MNNAVQAGSWPSRNPSEVWIVSSSTELVEKIDQVIRPLTPRIQVFAPAQAEKNLERQLRAAAPALIAIDVQEELDWGVRLLQQIKSSGAETATVILTPRFSREFGAKILSEGIRYYFPHDFCTAELATLAHSILKPLKEVRE